jgi:hypothetical protein
MNTETESAIGKRIGTSDGLYGVIVRETRCYFHADVVWPAEKSWDTDQVVCMRINKKTGNNWGGTNRWFYWV